MFILTICFQDTFSTEFILEGLEPYTSYQVQISVHNFYTLLDQNTTIGPPAVMTTKIGGVKNNECRLDIEHKNYVAL